MGFERNYQVKIHSKQHIQRRDYSSLPEADNKLTNVNKSDLNPWFITGFSDGECCFAISIRVSPRSSNHY